MRLTVDFETASADLVLGPTDRYEGDFCRIMAHGTKDTGFVVTSDQAKMRALLLDAEQIVTYNGFAFDLIAAARHLDLDWWDLVSKSRDLLVDAKLARPPAEDRRGEYDLNTVAGHYLGIGIGKSDELKRLKIAYGGYDLIPLEDPDYHRYAANDAELTDALADLVVPLNATYAERERMVAAIAGDLTLRGVRVDLDLLDRRLPEEAQRLDQVRRRLIEEWGFPAFLPSPKRNPKLSVKPWQTKAGKAVLAEIIEPYGDWPLTEKSDQYSTQASVLRDVIEEFPDTPLSTVAGLILEMTSTTLPKTIEQHRDGGRVHPAYSILTATGRWSSARPNILGVGKRSEVLLADRDLVVADEGNVFASVDLSGIDARCVAGLSGDREYASMFEPGVDIHTEMGEMFFNTRDKSARNAAKTVTHGLNYGRQARALAKMTGRSVAECQTLVDAYFRRFAQLAVWHSEVRSIGSGGGLLSTGSGRYVRVSPGRAFTEAPARLAQSAARDLAMDGLIACYNAGLGPYISLFVHDEVVVQAPPDLIEEVVAEVIGCMSFSWASPSGLEIPIVAATDGYVGPRWSDCYH